MLGLRQNSVRTSSSDSVLLSYDLSADRYQQPISANRNWAWFCDRGHLFMGAKPIDNLGYYRSVPFLDLRDLFRSDPTCPIFHIESDDPAIPSRRET